MRSHEDFERFQRAIGRFDGIHSEAEVQARAERASRVRSALTEEGYIFVTLWDAGNAENRKQVEKFVHPQSGAVILLEPMHGGGVEVYENTQGRSLEQVLERIRTRARRD